MLQSFRRRDFLKRLATLIPASVVLRHYRAMAATMRKKVRITDVKAMVVGTSLDWNFVKVETDGGITGIGEGYWGRVVKDVILGYLRDQVIGEDPLHIDS